MWWSRVDDEAVQLGAARQVSVGQHGRHNAATSAPDHALVANYLLIQADPGVVDVSVTSGPYDVVAEISPAAEHQQRIRETAQQAPGLWRLCVCQGLERSRALT